MSVPSCPDCGANCVGSPYWYCPQIALGRCPPVPEQVATTPDSVKMTTNADKAKACRAGEQMAVDEVARQAFKESAEYFEALETDGERCHECGGPVGLVWWCHDEKLWEMVTGNRREGRENAAGILCIQCFDAKAKNLCPWIEWAPVNLRFLRRPIAEREP